MIQQIKATLDSFNSYEVVKMRQGDTARNLQVLVYEGQQPYWLPPNASAVFNAKRVDGTKISYSEGLIVGENSVFVDEKVIAQAIILAGNIPCEIVLIDEGRELGTLNFNIVSMPAVITPRNIQSKDEYQSIYELLEKAEDINAHPWQIGENGNWWIWNTEAQKYEDSGIPSGNGDMHSAVYDEGGKVASAGGIANYVEENSGDMLKNEYAKSGKLGFVDSAINSEKSKEAETALIAKAINGGTFSAPYGSIKLLKQGEDDELLKTLPFGEIAVAKDGTVFAGNESGNVLQCAKVGFEEPTPITGMSTDVFATENHFFSKNQDGRVFVQIECGKSLAFSNGVVVGVLPENYRPSSTIVRAAQTVESGVPKFATIIININGQMSVYLPSGTSTSSLSGEFSFMAAEKNKTIKK